MKDITAVDTQLRHMNYILHMLFLDFSSKSQQLYPSIKVSMLRPPPLKTICQLITQYTWLSYLSKIVDVSIQTIDNTPYHGGSLLPTIISSKPTSSMNAFAPLYLPRLLNLSTPARVIDFVSNAAVH